MDKLIITGGVSLKGDVQISGAKNAALPALAASLLAPGKSRLRHVPDLMDIKTMGRLLESLGAVYRYDKSLSEAEIDTSGINNFEAAYELVKTMRASVMVLGPLLARFGTARVSLPGGCAIGARPVNLHISALRKMGAEIALEDGYIIAKAERLRGASIYFDMATVTGTENLMMAASLAKGTTVMENAAREPEVVDLADMLTSMGAKVYGAGEGTIEIEGVDELKPFDHRVIPDRIEAGTFMAAAAITGGDIVLRGCETGHLEAVITKIKEIGVSFEKLPQGLRVKGSGRPVAEDVRTLPYPGFPTDMQAQFMALMSVADGTSIITETIFENRFMHAAELRRMGADISVQSGSATVKGVAGLKGADVMATDLRASASLVVAALAAEGQTTIHRLYHLDRGYEAMEEKLKGVGALLERVK
ncbi:MAG: UDP-N-acetylglucosamine 1-carboxyvinyltransferase [Thermodesulfovibrionales bacterium]|nr:UDP-N-acetylglucosamine 1-carboxyvinyltransferase [Thermodesulfovibrionales bacterium]